MVSFVIVRYLLFDSSNSETTLENVCRTESFMLQSAWNTSLVIDRTQSNELIVSTAVGSPNQLWYIDEKKLIRSSMDDFCLTSKGAL